MTVLLPARTTSRSLLELPRGVDLNRAANGEPMRSQPQGLSAIEGSGATPRIVASPGPLAKLARMCARREARP